MKKSKIAGIGFNVPNNVVTNHDLEDMIQRTNGLKQDQELKKEDG